MSISVRWLSRIISVVLIFIMLEQFGFPFWRTYILAKPFDSMMWLRAHGIALGIAISFYLIWRVRRGLFSRMDRLLLWLVILFFAGLAGTVILDAMRGAPLIEYKQGVYHLRFLAPMIGILVGLNMWLAWQEVHRCP